MKKNNILQIFKFLQGSVAFSALVLGESWNFLPMGSLWYLSRYFMEQKNVLFQTDSTGLAQFKVLNNISVNNKCSLIFFENGGRNAPRLSAPV